MGTNLDLAAEMGTPGGLGTVTVLDTDIELPLDMDTHITLLI